MESKEAILVRLNIQAVYSREIPSLKATSSNTGKGLCPFHDDHQPSLSVNFDDGLFHCFGCSAKGSIFDFYMKRHGVDFSVAKEALAKEAGLSGKSGKKVVKAYDYKDETGKLLFQTVRYEPKDFKQRRPDGKEGWIYDLQGVRPIPYNLPEVLKAKSVIIVEGEKDADNLKALGLIATTSPMGAGKWRSAYNEHFRGKRVVILTDNDDPGRKHAQAVAAGLRGISESVKVLELLGLPNKGDVSDWIAQGGTRDKLIESIKQAPEWMTSEVSMCLPPIAEHSDIPLDPLTFLIRGTELQLLECKVEWAVDKLLPKESITLLHGKGGIGKTWLCLILADAISKGVLFMGQHTRTMPVVYMDFENSLPVLVERVRKIGIEDVLFWHTSNKVLAPPKLDNTDHAHYKALPSGSLLIFDTLRASQSRDENNSQDMAAIMVRLKELRDMGFTILLLHHTPKGNDRTYKGSTAILDLADHVLSLHKVKKNNLEENADDEEGTDCLYRFGTKDKTRYEPFHLFLSFDPEKGFVKAADPDDEDLQAIQEVLTVRGPMNQKQLFEAVKGELDMHGKGKVVNLLRKGEGTFWNSRKDKRAVYYEALSCDQKSGYIGVDSGTHTDGVSEIGQIPAHDDGKKSTANSEVSACPGVAQTLRTDENVSFKMIQKIFPDAIVE